MPVKRQIGRLYIIDRLGNGRVLFNRDQPTLYGPLSHSNFRESDPGANNDQLGFSI